MHADLLRLTAVVAVSLILGLISSQFLLCLLAGLCIYLYWYYRMVYRVLQWLRRSNNYDPPNHLGIINEITREIYYMKLHHSKRKEKFSNFLKRFQEVTAALPDAIILLGENNEIEWANTLAEDYLEIHGHKDSGLRISNLIRHPEITEFLKKTEEKLVRRLEINSPSKPHLRLELRISPYGMSQRLLVARNITKAHRNDKMRKDFLANASHELRSPLTVIMGYLESIEDDLIAEKSIELLHIQQMKNQSDRMNRLISDMLRLSSLETENEMNNFNIVPVNEVLNTIHKEAVLVSGSMNHVIKIESDPNLCLRGNQNHIYSAFSNLVFNAVQYTPVNTLIKIRWHADKTGAHFEVIDKGGGIAEEHLSHITERFYRVDIDRHKNPSGSGLGLAIVKHVLAYHKASLDIESKVGEGSIFKCHFPLKLIVSKESGEGPTLSTV